MSTPGKVLLNNIVAELSGHYNLSAVINGATKETEPRASGGSCDVTFGVVAWTDVERNCKMSSNLSFAYNANGGSLFKLLKVAIKRARAHALNSLSPDKREKFIKRYAREIKIWSTLDHTNILPLLGYADEHHTFPSLITAWMEYGTAKQFLRDYPSGQATRVALRWGFTFCSSCLKAMDITNGLAYLHLKYIIHGDLKADNVLVSNAGTALLADFGVSRVLMSDEFANLKTSSNNVNGTLRWMAAEQLTATDVHERYTLATDIWSLGMTFYELISGKIPFEHIKSEPLVMFAIMKYQSPHESEDPWLQLEQERKLWSLCRMCWWADPKERPTIVSLKELLLLSQALTQEASTLFAVLLNRQPQQSQPPFNYDSTGKVPEHWPIRLAFNEYLKIWWEQNNSSVLTLFVHSQQIDLFDMYTEAIRLGGSDEVNRHELWPVVAVKAGWVVDERINPLLDRCGEPTLLVSQAIERLKSIYNLYLLPYEKRSLSSLDYLGSSPVFIDDSRSVQGEIGLHRQSSSVDAHSHRSLSHERLVQETSPNSPRLTALVMNSLTSDFGSHSDAEEDDSRSVQGKIGPHHQSSSVDAHDHRSGLSHEQLVEETFPNSPRLTALVMNSSTSDFGSHGDAEEMFYCDFVGCNRYFVSDSEHELHVVLIPDIEHQSPAMGFNKFLHEFNQ